MIRLGVDIGGTFTDFALIDREGRRTAVHKRLTTPADPARAVIEGVAAIAEENRIAVGEIGEIVHGTTLVTNALLERRGARVGMLVTAGFRDTFDIGQEQRYDLYDLRLRFAEPLVPRRLRVEIDERMRHDGTVITPLDPAEIRAAVARLVAEDGIEALAICFLHAYANPAHEEAARAAIAAAHPGLYLSHSAGVFPYAREFERWTTTCANAYAQPMVDAYLGRLQAGLGAIGFRGHLAVIGSSGGLLSVDTARRFPVRLLESGPAAGVLMSARLGRELAIDSLLSFDLGGTTAKGALVRHGAAFKKYSFEAAHAYKYRSGSGLTLQIPVIDMSEIGAGGGSIVAVDELGLLRVGPRSAGADPGPACYGRGGQDATLSDANLALGYLDAGFFLGGKMRLDPALATRAIREKAARPLDLDLIRAAWGIHDIANEDISRAFRMHATERGFDYRRSGMIAFGGGGPIHAARIARKLKVPRVIYPAGAGVMSAFGMLVGAVSFEVMRSGRRALSDLTGPMLAATLAPLEAEASSYLLATGLRPDQIRLDRRVDMRYRGQGYDLEVRLPGGMSADDLIASLPALHAEAYREVFHMVLDQPLEIVSWKVEARGPEPDLPAREAHPDRRAAVDALKGSRPAFFPAAGGLIDCPVYDRYALRPGDAILGPCLVEERESTCLLDVGDEGQIDAMGNLVSRIAI